MRKNFDIWQDIFTGIEDGKKAFSGPHTVQIDLTDKCNNTCIGCWVHSPLLNKKEVFPQGEKELPFRLVKKLINQLYQLGTKEIILSGSGEPFMYPEITEVIKLIKSKGMYLNIITNAILMTEEVYKFLVDNKVDLITASIWAGTPEGYIATHPGKSKQEFEKIKDNLVKFSLQKKHCNSLFPHLKVYNVICSKNYNEIENMINFAKNVDADSVEFQAVDIIEGKTDFLALSASQVEAVFEQFRNIRRRKDMVFYGTPKEASLEEFLSNEFSDFGKIWKDYHVGFKLSPYAEEMRCPRGYKGKKRDISYIALHESTKIGAFKYQFLFGKECDKCSLKNSCFDNGEIGVRNVNLLNLLGIGTFLRRISPPRDKFAYDVKVNSIPCYIGWYYARILTNGDVIPCCKAAKFPLGNLYNDTFLNIWHSKKYNEFRFNAKNLTKTDPYFSKINCIKACDNWGMNLEIHNKGMKETPLLKAHECNVVIIPAKDFKKGNLNPGYHNFGRGLVIDGGSKWGFAEYEFYIEQEGKYSFYSRYASGDFRPVDIYIDGNLVKKMAMSKNTGGWNLEHLIWDKECEIYLKKGRHILRIHSSGCIPHIERFAFIRGKTPEFILKEQKSNYIFQVKKNILSKGFKDTIGKIRRNLNPRYLSDRYLEILGIYDGEYGYKGPFHIQIDLTNNCNNNCIACWCNSPLFKKPRFSPEEKKQYLSTLMVKELLDEVTRMGAIEIYYSGGGEPFMHPEIMDILEYTKKKGLICHVNTNFTLLDKQRLNRLIEMGVDFLTVSIWSGTPQTYARTHSNKTEKDFYRIKDNLIYLNTHKKDKPRIKLYNVLFNMNYFEIEKMIDFAQETHSESVEFTLADTIPSVTDVLRLNKEQFSELVELCKKVKSRLDKDNRINGILLFQFDQFLRRVSVARDVQEAKYDRNIIDSMPCYIGWLFARVVPNGEVHSCLKAHRIPTGSLYLNNFSEIWNSDKQKYFRKKTLVYKKSDPFFKLIGNDPYIQEAGCYKSCDDIGRNNWMHKRFSMLSLPEKIVFKSIAKSLKIVRRVKPEKDNYKKYHKDPVIAGILHGRKAFAGPEQVVIDPTNRCNLRCISCWLYSPYLTKDKPSPEWLKEELSKKTLIKLIDDLSFLGTRRIRFTGGGEPFMHKDLMDIIEYARKKNLLVAITTNFALVSRKDIKRLIDLGLEELCVSIWASNPYVYSKVHYNTSGLYFEKLKENLIYLKEIKEDKPRVTFANVIMNTNFRDFENMYNFGLKYGADALYFTIVDVMPNQTDRLLLKENERKELLKRALEIKERSKGDNIKLEFFDGFLRRISKQEESFTKGEYDKIDIDKIPCYVGWIFSRILADGSVVPCCRAVKKVMGNINITSFKDIWNSLKYNEFRAKAKYLSKTDPYFKNIGCIKECDNLMHNEEMHKKLYKW